LGCETTSFSGFLKLPGSGEEELVTRGKEKKKVVINAAHAKEAG
jgi:hypothetical protein